MSTFNITLDPAQIEFVVKPGVTLTQAYNVTNNSSETISLNTVVLPWEPVGIDGNVNYQNVAQNPNITFSLLNADLKLGQSFMLAPNSKQQIVLKISSTQNTGLNDYYYTFFVTQNPQSGFGADSSVSQAYGQIGSHILLSVSNTENPTALASIRNFSISPRFKDIFFTPVAFTAEIKNNSNNFFKTQGKLTITKNDRKIAETELKNDNVLAHHSRALNCKDQESCVLNPPFWPGHYTATLALDQSLGGEQASISFFVFPFSLLAFSISILLLILLFRKITKSIFHSKK